MQGLLGLIATPFGYVMRFMYDFIGNYGVCIILFSLFVKIVTSPLTLKQKRSMQATQRLQPKIQAIQKKYYNDKQKMNEELAKNTGKDLADVEKDVERDYFMTAEQAKAYGIIDEIIAPRR